jgi:hypothetical protein
VLQDPTPTVATHRSPLPTDEHRRPTPFAPPHRRPAVLVRPCPLLLTRHLPRDPLEISGNTLPPLSHRRAADEHAIVPSCAQSARGDRTGARAAAGRAGRLLAGLGCQAVAQPAFRPTARGRPPRPVGSSLGPASTRYCAGDFKCFSNCFKPQKLM